MSRANFKLSAKKSLLACSLFALTACGGGGGDSSGIELEAGVFDTTVVYGNGTSESALTFYSSSGKYVTVFDPDETSFGSLRTSNSSIQGPSTDYNFSTTWEKAEGSASGSVESEERAILDKTGGFAPATVTVQRVNELSDVDLSLAKLSSTYSLFRPDDSFQTGPSSSLTIDSSGALTGSDSTGCVYNGNVSIPDGSVNIFEVAYTASNCGTSARAGAASRNGSFEGIGFYGELSGEKTITLVANNGQIVEIFTNNL